MSKSKSCGFQSAQLPAHHKSYTHFFSPMSYSITDTTAMGSALKKQRVSKQKPYKVTKKVEEVEKTPVEESEPESLPEEEAEQENVEEDDEEEFEQLDDIDLDDEVDVADVSSGESGSEDESGSEEESGSDEDDEDVPKLKKKKNLDDGSASFATAFNAIIGSKLKAYDRNDPILARNKITLKKLESDKLEAKAKKAISSEKKSLYDKHRVTQLLPSSSEPEKVRQILDHERKLKKVAQKGVVRLFNAVLSTQIRTNQEVSKEKVGQTKKEELMNEISKEKFLDLVQAAGQS